MERKRGKMDQLATDSHSSGRVTKMTLKWMLRGLVMISVLCMMTEAYRRHHKHDKMSLSEGLRDLGIQETLEPVKERESDEPEEKHDDPDEPQHLTKAGLRLGRKVWLADGTEGVIDKIGYDPKGANPDCWPRGLDIGRTCVGVAFRDTGNVYYYSPTEKGDKYMDLFSYLPRPPVNRPATGFQRSESAAAQVETFITHLPGVDRNIDSSECLEYIRLIYNGNRTQEAISWMLQGDRTCHNTYLGNSYDPTSPLPGEEMNLYKERLLTLYETYVRTILGVLGEQVQDLVAYVKRNAYLGYVKRLNKDLFAESTIHRTLPGFWGLFLASPHHIDEVEAIQLDSLFGKVPRKSIFTREPLKKWDYISMYAGGGSWWGHFLRISWPESPRKRQVFTYNLLGSGLDLSVRYLWDLPPGFVEPQVELLQEMQKLQLSGDETVRLPFSPSAEGHANLGWGTILNADSSYRHLNEKFMQVSLLANRSVAFVEVPKVFSRGALLITLYNPEKQGRLYGQQKYGERFEAFFKEAFDQLVTFTAIDERVRLPYASTFCPELSSCVPTLMQEKDLESHGVFAMCRCAHLVLWDSYRLKRYNTNQDCLAARIGVEERAAQCPATSTWKCFLPRYITRGHGHLPLELQYLDEFGYFEFDRHAERLAISLAFERFGVPVPVDALTTVESVTAFKHMYSMVASFCVFLASDDSAGSLGDSFHPRHVTVGVRNSMDWSNWNIRCADAEKWRGRGNASLECDQPWVTYVWNDMKDIIQSIDSIMMLNGLPCHKIGAEDAYITRLAHHLKGVLQVFMEMVFNKPLSEADWSFREPLEQTPLFLFSSREAIESGFQVNYTRLGCELSPESTFLELASDGAENLERVCTLPEVEHFFGRIRELQEKPPSAAELRSILMPLRRHFGYVLRLFFRDYAASALSEFPEIAALFGTLPLLPVYGL